MKSIKKLRGFTLTELIVAMLLFTMVMAASGTAIITAITMLYKTSDKTISSAYAANICDSLTEKIRYGVNVEIVSALDTHQGAYDMYLDDEDIILYVGKSGNSSEEGKIFLVTDISGSNVTKSVLYEINGMDITLGCTPDKTEQRVKFDLKVTEEEKPDKTVYTASAAARRLNTHTGGFKADSETVHKQGYYIFIDNS